MACARVPSDASDVERMRQRLLMWMDLLLGRVLCRARTRRKPRVSGRNVRYEGDKLLDHADDGVMMEWETPIMKAHAELLCGTDADRDVLNVGVRVCLAPPPPDHAQPSHPLWPGLAPPDSGVTWIGLPCLGTPLPPGGTD